MTEQQATPAQGSAASQLKQLIKDRATQGLGLAATATGQKAGTVAQAVRQTGEEMRSQGQESQGQRADQVAQPVQKFSGYLSQADPQQLTDEVKQAKPKLSQQVQQLKTQASSKLAEQADTRSTQAGQGITSLNQAMRQTSQQLRAQGEEGQALALDALLDKVEPLGPYLTQADADRLKSDAATYGRQAKEKLSKVTNAVSQKKQTASTKSSEAAKQTVSGVRQSPLLPLMGVVAGGVLARRKLAKSGQQPPTTEPATVEATETVTVVETDPVMDPLATTATPATVPAAPRARGRAR